MAPPSLTTPERYAAALDALDVLLDAVPAERDAELARLLIVDPQLAATVRALLGADAAERCAVDTLMPLACALARAADEDAADALGAGDALGPFALCERLGSGGMGEVWRAERRSEGFVQQVAIKRIRGGLASPEARARFAQERRILAGLQHPGIAAFVDGGVDAAGVPWYAMAHVAGQPVDTWARQRRPDARACVELVVAICDAVAYAHARLIVHRDLKPDNILVDADGRPVLLDFGIAKLLSGEAGDALDTATHVRAMSPAYAAPEQVLGEPVTTATDVYALGLVLYQLLTGELPHRRQEITLERLAESVRRERHAPPGEVARRHGRRDVDSDLDTIVLCALRREPERRYPGAAALAQDLRLWLEQRPILARGDSAGYRMRKFVDRHRIAVASATAAVLALTFGLGVALWQAGIARDAARRAAEQAALAQAQARRAELVQGFFARTFQQASPLLQQRGAELTALEWVREAATRVERELAEDADARSEIRMSLAMALRAFGARDDARAQAQAALDDLAAPGAPDNPRAQSAAAQTLGDMDAEDGRADSARRHYELAHAANARIADPEQRQANTFRLRTSQLTLANRSGRPQDALPLARAILADRQARFGADDPRTAVDWNNLGQTLNFLDRHDEAAQALAEGLRVMRADPKSSIAGQAYLLHGLARAEYGRGQLETALDHIEAAIALGERAFGTSHRAVARARVVRAELRMVVGRSDGIAAGLDEVVASTAADDPPTALSARRHRAQLALRAGRATPRLRDELEQVVAAEMARPAAEQGAWPLLQSRLLLALALADLGEEGALRDAVDAALAALAPQPSSYRHAEALLLAACALEAAGDARAQSLRARGDATASDAWGDSATLLDWARRAGHCRR